MREGRGANVCEASDSEGEAKRPKLLNTWRKSSPKSSLKEKGRHVARKEKNE